MGQALVSVELLVKAMRSWKVWLFGGTTVLFVVLRDVDL
jgi:hypothetical protein